MGYPPRFIFCLLFLSSFSYSQHLDPAALPGWLQRKPWPLPAVPYQSLDVRIDDEEVEQLKQKPRWVCPLSSHVQSNNVTPGLDVMAGEHREAIGAASVHLDIWLRWPWSMLLLHVCTCWMENLASSIGNNR